jgi:hypothetical protein
MTTIAKLAAGTALAAALAQTAAAQDALPRFLQMDGAWTSHAVKAEPAALLEDPAFAAAHRIVGSPNPEAASIFFEVRRDGDADPSWLMHAYDRATNTTHGVFAQPGAGVIRVEARHGPDADEVVFYDASGEVVAEERSVWTSDDAFETVSDFTVDGEPARIWYVTRRAGEEAGR